MSEIRYSIKIASERSGVSAHLIRMWEKRYGALSPDRTETNRRLYSDDDIERLSLLHDCTKQGHRIGNIAALSIASLRELAPRPVRPAPVIAAPSPPPALTDIEASLPPAITPAYRAIRQLDAEALRHCLDQASIDFGYQGMLTKVAVPLMQHIGRLWCEGELTAAYEHFASSTLRTYLLGQSQAYTAHRNAPVLITVTPTGQLHELGAVVSSAAAHALGWHTIHLGPSLPAAEIAGAAIRAQADLVALSLVHPPDDPDLPAQLRMLRRLLPHNIGIIVGGHSALGYHPTLQEIQAQVVTDFDHFNATLTAHRQQSLNPLSPSTDQSNRQTAS